MSADAIADADALRRLHAVEQATSDVASDMREHAATCLGQHQAIGVRFDGVDQRLDGISKQLSGHNRMAMAILGVILTGEVFGWKQAIAAALHFLGVAP